jgi:hypothetical protein
VQHLPAPDRYRDAEITDQRRVISAHHECSHLVAHLYCLPGVLIRCIEIYDMPVDGVTGRLYVSRRALQRMSSSHWRVPPPRASSPASRLARLVLAILQIRQC